MADEPSDIAEGLDNQASADRRLTSVRSRLQLALLVFALTGLIYAGREIWSKRETIRFWGGQTFEPVDPWESFDLGHTSIPRDQIYSGGPPKDGIPALSDPQMLRAAEAEFPGPDDRVIGVTVNDESRAYPLKILEYHEAINDHVGGLPVAVTYCPLCDSAAVFDRRHEDMELEFGISGLLYNSNVLLYDRRGGIKESLWSQLSATAVSGPQLGGVLKTLPLELTTWADWSARYPTSLVLSPETGHHRDYDLRLYTPYFKSPDLAFPVTATDARLPLKTRVLGVWTTTAQRAYPLSAFAEENGLGEIEQELEGLRFTIAYNPAAGALRIVRADDGVQWMYAFWFAWFAFHPETSVFEATPSVPAGEQPETGRQ